MIRELFVLSVLSYPRLPVLQEIESCKLCQIDAGSSCSFNGIMNINQKQNIPIKKRESSTVLSTKYNTNRGRHFESCDLKSAF